MPQATPELSQAWDEESAWDQLAFKTTETAGVIRFRDGYPPTDDDLRAVDYLCQEWDYGYAQ